MLREIDTVVAENLFRLRNTCAVAFLDNKYVDGIVYHDVWHPSNYENLSCCNAIMIDTDYSIEYFNDSFIEDDKYEGIDGRLYEHCLTRDHINNLIIKCGVLDVVIYYDIMNHFNAVNQFEIMKYEF